MVKTTKEKQKKMEQILGWLDNLPIIVFDIETTATNPNQNYGKLIEVAAVKLDQHYQIIDRFDELIDPEIPLSNTTQNITGITKEMLKGKRKYPEVVKDFIKFCSGDVVIAGHNISTFDIRFVNYFANLIGMTFNPPRVADTLFMARNTDIKKKCSSYKLEALADYFGVDDPSHHRAMNDVLVNTTILNILHQKAKAIGFKPVYDANELLNDKEDSNFIGSLKQSNLKEAEVCSYSTWVKKTEKKTFRRLYVNILVDEVYIKAFYDFDLKEWRLNPGQKITFNIDWNSVELEIALSKGFKNKEMVREFENYA